MFFESGFDEFQLISPALSFCFIAFSSREPVPTSLENALISEAAMAYPNPIPPNTVFTYKATDPELELIQLKLSQIEVELAWLHLYHDLRRQALLKAYNPDQPRIPAGQTGGGRWTSGFSTAEPAATRPDDWLRLAHHFNKEELGMSVQDFIALKCKASIYSVLPSEFLELTISETLSIARSGNAKAKSCIKLLDRPEYHKGR